MTPFQPAWGLTNPHVQSILASSSLRKPRLKRQGRALRQADTEQVLELESGIKLHGVVSRQPASANDVPMVVLIHGWEGCYESIYLWSAAIHFFQAGYDVFRLHLRDHGPSHHLNDSLFHAARIDEVHEALGVLAEHHVRGPLYLVGYSLGGNFALRAAAMEPFIPLSSVAAISPVVRPDHTYEALELGPAVYHRYFVRKWQRSLARKARLYPDLLDMEVIRSLTTLKEMTIHLVSGHTVFDDVEAYFASYTLTRDLLARIPCPTWVLTAADDPIIPVRDFTVMDGLPNLSLSVEQHGGHCGFVENWRLTPWVDRQLLGWFARAKEKAA